MSSSGNAAIIVFVVCQSDGIIEGLRSSGGICPVQNGMTDAEAIAMLNSKKTHSQSGASQSYVETNVSFFEDGQFKVYTFKWTEEV